MRRGCVRSFLIPDHDIDEVLPVDGDTRIDLGVLARAFCALLGMGMYTGAITAS